MINQPPGGLPQPGGPQPEWGRGSAATAPIMGQSPALPQQQMIQRILQMIMNQRQAPQMPGQPTGPIGDPQSMIAQQNPTVPSPMKAQQQPQGDTFTVTAPNGQKVKLKKDEFAQYNANKDSFWLDYAGGKYSH